MITDTQLVDGKRRQALTIVALVITILVGAGTLYGILTYPVRVENRLVTVETKVTANIDRLKALEDTKPQTQGKLDLLIYQQGENKEKLDKIAAKLNILP